MSRRLLILAAAALAGSGCGPGERANLQPMDAPPATQADGVHELESPPKSVGQGRIGLRTVASANARVVRPALFDGDYYHVSTGGICTCDRDGRLGSRACPFDRPQVLYRADTHAAYFGAGWDGSSDER